MPVERHTEPAEPYRTRILQGLLQLVKPNGGVWCSPGECPRIRYDQWSTPRYLSWSEAAKLTSVVVPKGMHRASWRTEEEQSA